MYSYVLNKIRIFYEVKKNSYILNIQTDFESNIMYPLLL